MSSSGKFSALQIIAKRRRNIAHADDELQWWMDAYTQNVVPDYQMSAWLMATCWQGLTARETATLTRCMVQSGVTLDWDQPTLPWRNHHWSSTMANGAPCRRRRPYLVDKHSSGGVGDKVSIVLAPLVATMHADLAVPMMAGRGLGHTGGTIDKLESIPGMTCELELDRFQHIVATVGCCIGTTRPNLCPTDRKLYALRDVTGTVSCVPLQTASIMCKKIAEHPDSLVLDVKVGVGAFQETMEAAQALASSIVATGEANGLVPTTALITGMDNPLGYAIGNWLEIKECVELLQGNLQSQQQLSGDLIELVCIQTAQMCLHSGRFAADASLESLAQQCYNTLDSGQALPKFVEMVHAQGGDVSYIHDLTKMPRAPYVRSVLVMQTGVIASMNALEIGLAAVQVGAGRRVATDAVDALAGVVLHAKVGMFVVAARTVVATVHASNATLLEEAAARILAAVVIQNDGNIVVPPVVRQKVTTSGGIENVNVSLF